MFGKTALIFFLSVCVWNSSAAPGTARYAVQDEDRQGRMEDLKNRITLHPDSAALHIKLGNLFLESEEWGKAQTEFEKAVALDELSAEAHNGLGLALHGKGESIFIPIEKIKKLFKVDNYSLAEKQFKRALELNPEYLDPLYNMGVNFIAKGGEDSYRQAVSTLETLRKKDPLYKDADFMTGMAFLNLKDWDRAEKTFGALIEANRSTAKAMLRLSQIYMETEREDKAVSLYYESLMKITDEKIFQDIYIELKPLMTRDESVTYGSLPLEEKGVFIRKFWKRRDPTPTTEANERFVEHFHRVRMAMENYPDIIPPYYDDRGKVYVKYGEPDAKFASPVYGEQIYENESWSYEQSVMKGLTFDFVKKGHSFREVRDLSEAAAAGTGSAYRNSVIQQLYFDRASFTEAYAKFALGPGTINQSVMADFHANRMETYKEAPAEVFNYKPTGGYLPFVYNIAQFRESNERVGLEIYMGVPESRLNFIPVSDGMVTDLLYTIVIEDSNYFEVLRESRTKKAQAAGQAEIQNRLLLSQERVSIPRGRHMLALKIENTTGSAKGEYKNIFETLDFTGDNLMLSDIQLSMQVAHDTSEGEFIKHGLKVLPYPYTVIRKKNPVYVYYEIYNLKFGGQGRTDYSITYNVEMLEYQRSFLSRTVGSLGRLFSGDKKMGFSSTFQQTGQVSTSREYLSLDMNKLPVGSAILKLQVRDNASGENASRSIQIQLIE